MMMQSRLLILSFAVLTLSSCLQTRAEVTEQEEKKKIQSTVTTLQKTRADQEARFDSIDAELRQLNGKIESVDHRISTSSENQKNNDTNLGKRVDELLTQMKIFDETLLKAHQRIDVLEKEVLTLKAAGPAEKGSAKADPLKEADEYFENKEWKRAITAYQKFREANPKSSHNGMATYRIGVAFQELGMKGEAETFFKEVIREYPKDSAAKSAAFRLRQLKKQ